MAIKFVQLEKSADYIFNHRNDDLHLIRCVRVPSKKSIDGKTLEEYTSFRTKMLRKMSVEEIEEAINDENTVLIRIE